jgi:hypothetical protein
LCVRTGAYTRVENLRVLHPGRPQPYLKKKCLPFMDIRKLKP